MAAENQLTALLPLNSLRNVRVGVSVSNSPDLGRLGLAETHLRMALGEIARVILLAGGRLVYGGHLDPGGYTAFLQSELEKYARKDRPLLSCLAWPVHRQLKLTELTEARKNLGMYGQIVCLGTDGTPIDAREGRGEEPEPVTDADVRASSLTALRHYLVSETDARVLVGGRRSGYQGAMPGVIEEAVIAISAGQPVFLAAGFGGATFDVARVLGLTPDGWPNLRDTARDAGLDALEAAARDAGWGPEANGLSEEENLRLAASHRASDVASLVALGLGRLRERGTLRGEPA